jgi:pre-mRNA branch site protein p14
VALFTLKLSLRLLTYFFQAKNALDHLNGFHLRERYIVVLYHMPAKQDAAAAKAEIAKREEELAQLKRKHDIGDLS